MLGSASLFIFVLSFLLPLVSVHTYCENRTLAAVFGVISITVLLMFLRYRAASTARKIVAIIGGALCFLALALNVQFILHATHLCR